MIAMKRLSLLCWLASAVSAAIPRPISIPPGSNLYGIDGQWRTFELAVGSPVQYVQVLIDIAASQVITILPSGCQSSSEYEACVVSRGGVFNTSASSTYREIGNYGFSVDDNLNISSTAAFGFDSVSLGTSASPSFTVSNTTIGGTALFTYYLGYFGLRPQDTRYTAEEPSIISQLKDLAIIPSLSFGYTTGAKYANRAANLVLGGYDSSISTANGVSFPIGEDRPFTLQINHINTTTRSQQLLSSAITAAVDSSVTEWYLPESVCDNFASVFGLTYDDFTQLYFVNDTTYSMLNATRPNITISVSPSTSNSSAVDMIFPWAAFDLTALYPYQGLLNQQRFFPIRRANSTDQYTLGRSFLQEAYISVDWERNVFNLSQCSAIPDSSTRVLEISPVNSASSNSQHHSGLGGGAIAGIVIGVVVGVLLIVALIVLSVRKRRQKAAALAAATGSSESDDNTVFPKAELDASDDQTYAYEKRAPGGELDSMPQATQAQRAEAPNTQLEVFEMPGDTPKRAEMPTPAQLQATEKEAQIEREKLYNGVPTHEAVQTASNPSSPTGTEHFSST